MDYQTGEVVERSAHQAYGMIDTDFRPNPRWGAFREDVKFGGHWDNAEVGLTYFGARYYSPQLGRFVSPDPLAIHGLHGINPYEYASGSPLRYVDPDGLDGEDPSWDELSIEQQAAYEAAMAAAENVDNEWTASDPSERPVNASDAPSATPEELPSESVTGPSECSGACAEFLAGGTAVAAAPFSGGLSLGLEALGGLSTEALPFLVVNAARVTAFFNTLTLAEQGIAIGAGSAATAAGYTAIGSTGQIGEQALKELGGQPQVFFRTTLGARFIDQLVNGAAHEAKVGYTSLTPRIALQVAKDGELVRTVQVSDYTWHFFLSPVTGKGGPSEPLLNQLEQAGINIKFHF